MTTSISEPAEAAAAAQAIREAALELGFDVCGFCDTLVPWPAAGRLEAFVRAGRHGEMLWMAETLERRSHPRAMWDGARSAIMLGLNYGPDRDPREILRHPEIGAISVYAQGDDYHDLIKKRLKSLGRWMQARFGGELKVFVDTAPLMEKPLAERAGLGWQGKHTNLVSRSHGSWLFLGAILTSLDLPADTPGAESCGSCQACIEACPTGAFPAPFQLDARRCISYLTIELKGPVPREFRSALGSRIYGCDDCLAACPWNKFAREGREMRLAARDSLRAPALRDLVGLNDAEFRALFARSPVKRIGRARFVRNVLYALGNLGDPKDTCLIQERLDDPDPVVRGAAVWALARTAPEDLRLAERTRRLELETDDTVRAEWLSPA